MTALHIVARTDEDAPDDGPAGMDEEVGALVSAVAAVLLETVARLDRTVSHITDITVMRASQADRDLIVALQDFDRLQQEFATIGNVLGRLPAMSRKRAPTSGRAADHPLIAAISLADLKERLVRQLSDATTDVFLSGGPDEAEF